MARIENRKKSGAEAPTKGDLTRQRILAATAKVLSHKGFASTRLSDIAEEANMQAPAIYYYYDSREELIVEVIRYGSADTCKIVAAVLDALPSGYDPLQRIMVAVEVHLRHMLEISDFATAAARNLGQLPDELKTAPQEEQRRYGFLWLALVKEAMAAELCAPDLDPALSVLLLLGALNYTAEWYDPERGSVDRIVKSAQSLVHNALAGAKADSEKTYPQIGEPSAWLAARSSTDHAESGADGTPSV